MAQGSEGVSKRVPAQGSARVAQQNKRPWIASTEREVVPYGDHLDSVVLAVER